MLKGWEKIVVSRVSCIEAFIDVFVLKFWFQNLCFEICVLKYLHFLNFRTLCVNFVVCACLLYFYA